MKVNAWKKYNPALQIKANKYNLIPDKKMQEIRSKLHNYYLELTVCQRRLNVFLSFSISLYLSSDLYSIHLSAYISLIVYICPSIYPSLCLPIPFICSSFYLSIHSSVHHSIFPSIHLFVFLSVHSIICPSVWPFICPPVLVYTYRSVFPSKHFVCFSVHPVCQSVHPNVHASVI
jgi:hypothetical protein